MTTPPTRTCKWCGNKFAAEPDSTTLYCKRAHKTAAEKARKRIRQAGINPCPEPGNTTERYRGDALVTARRLGVRYLECVCGGYHVHTLDVR